MMLAALALATAVTLQTAAGDLHGTLLVPESQKPMPVVLLISGSGPTDRDGNSALLEGKNDSLKMLAESLAARGIASLRYDKRGVAESASLVTSERDLTFELYIDDATAWLQQLRADRRFSLVAVAGHSEGALIGVVAAQRAGVDRVISIAGSGRPAADLLLEQLAGAGLTAEQLALSRTIVASLVAGKTYAGVPLELFALFRPSVQPYLISWFRYDPAAEIAKLVVPTLVAQGTTDIQVSLADAYRLANANRAASLVVIDGMNHVLKDVPPDPAAQERSYSDPTLPIDQRLVDAVAHLIAPPARRRVAR